MPNEVRKFIRKVVPESLIFAIISYFIAIRMPDFFNRCNPKNTNHKLIRIGGEGDGGYLIPDDLEDIDALFSPGVANNANFELELAKRWGIKCFMADNSIDKPPIENELFDFEKKHLGAIENENFMTLENWVKRKAMLSDSLILQMDIEGCEYEVIKATSRETLRKFRIIIIEFHRLTSLFDIFGFTSINNSFMNLLKDFCIVHIHPNNSQPAKMLKGYEIPPIMEFTFIRKDRVIIKQSTLAFPHDLDRKNVTNEPEIVLPKCWYLSGEK